MRSSLHSLVLDPRPQQRLLLILLGGLIALLGVAIQFKKLHNSLTPSEQSTVENVAGANMSAKTTDRTPVFFLSHGGPTIFEDTHHPVYPKLQSIGRDITQTIKPKAIVVISAHWQGERDLIEVNTAESLPLIYDFYGFPPHFYEVQFPNRGSPELADRIIGMLSQAGIEAEGRRRGLDHGVWASFMCAFNPKENPLDVPIVQLSLFDSDSAAQHHRLGQALAPLRSEGVLIITSGMAVHNLRDFRFTGRGLEGGMPYAHTFDAALQEAVEQPVEQRELAMSKLLVRDDARKAHPSFEHLLPVFVGAGAAGLDKGEQIWTKVEGSVSWGMYRFG